MRLALFAEMVKGKPWAPATLQRGRRHGRRGRHVPGRDVQLTAGQSRASPAPEGSPGRPEGPLARDRHRHQGPDAVGGRACGKRRGYADRPRDFADLIHILDPELRLITPTEPEGLESAKPEWTSSAGELGRRHATSARHDQLLPAHARLPRPLACDWLTRKQRETRRGRAELRLAERAALWNAKPENRHLPSLLEWLSIRTLTDSAHWTEPQRKMMRQAARTHGWRSALTLAGMIAVAAAGVVLRNQVAERQEATRIEGLVGRLVSAEPSQVPDVVKQLDANPEVAAPLLARLISGKAETPDEKRAQLHARLAMVSRDPSQVEPLVEELLAGKVAYVLPIRQLLRPAAGPAHGAVPRPAAG